MSAEIYDKNPDNDAVAQEIGIQVAKILIATGEKIDRAYVIGAVAAQYGAHLLLSALEFSGEISSGAAEGHEDYIQVIADLTINPDHAAYYNAMFEAEHPGVISG